MKPVANSRTHGALDHHRRRHVVNVNQGVPVFDRYVAHFPPPLAGCGAAASRATSNAWRLTLTTKTTFSHSPMAMSCMETQSVPKDNST
ncbi:MAG TPA: hypothetical protein VFR09_00130 [Alphaproteobacteria bacterium]|nr:hypothetical protein [Alphaproteobacteria bacterium]